MIYLQALMRIKRKNNKKGVSCPEVNVIAWIISGHRGGRI